MKTTFWGFVFFQDRVKDRTFASALRKVKTHKNGSSFVIPPNLYSNGKFPLSLGKAYGKFPARLEMLELHSTWGRFINSVPGRINDESLVFVAIIFVDAFHPMVVPIVEAKLSS